MLWIPPQPQQFLKDVPALETAGVIVRMPASWRMGRPAHPKVTATVGGKAPGELGLEALLDFRIEVTLEGRWRSSAAEVRKLLAETNGLAFIRGRWVEIDRERLGRTLDRFETIERRAADEGLSFGEAMRLVAGAAIAEDGAAGRADADWSETVAGPWLAETLAALRRPSGTLDADPGKALQATLRPLSEGRREVASAAGATGAGRLPRRRHGTFGKTIQILALLLVLKAQKAGVPRPSLLVVPASLLANWSAEIARFAPTLKAVVVHPSVASGRDVAIGGRRAGGRCRPSRSRATAILARVPSAGGDVPGVSRFSTRPRRSRIPAPGRAARSSSCAPMPASR